MDIKKSVSEFLQNKPLYSKLEVDEKYFHPMQLHGHTFQFFCQNENQIQTFKLFIEPEEVIAQVDRLTSIVDDAFDPYQKDKTTNFTHHYTGECQYCQKYRVHFLINGFSDAPIPGLTQSALTRGIGGRASGFAGGIVVPKQQVKDEVSPKLFLVKIGQYPPFEINPDKEIFNFLQGDNKEYYKKSLICYSQGFGIAAYAYLRRIVESEIIRIVELLCDEKFPDNEKIQELYERYKANNQMSNLIEGIYKYLPESLKSIGSNPLKILYSHLSEGIHTDDEDACLKKSFLLDTILKVTIKKINEEKTEMKEVRQALKNLGH